MTTKGLIIMIVNKILKKFDFDDFDTYEVKYDEIADRKGVQFSTGESFVDSVNGDDYIVEHAVYDPATSELVVFQECEAYPLECIGCYWTGVSQGLWEDLCYDHHNGTLIC